MPQTKVRSPSGEIITVEHPEGASEQEIIAYAQKNTAVTPEPAPTTKTGIFGREWPANDGPSFSMPEKIAGMGEKLLSLATSTALTPVAGLGGIAAGLIPGGATGAEAVKTIQGMAYQPKTAAGRQPTLIGDAMSWLEQKADTIGEVSGGPGDVLGATLVKTAILGAPALIAGRGAIKSVVGGVARGNLLPTTGKPAPAAPPSNDAMGLSAETVTDTGTRIVNNTFQAFREKVGPDTQAPMTNTIAAIQQALDDLVKQGKGKSSLAKELRAVQAGNPGGTTSVSILDDIAANMMKSKANPAGSGPKQAQLVLDGAIADMNVAGKAVGLNFVDDLASARAFAELYRGNNLGRVVGQYGDTIKAYKAADPAGFQEIITDWTGKKLESFVRTNVAGGREFNTGKFGQWVAQNEANLTKIVGPETVGVWKAFPKWQGRATFLKGLGQRFLEVKTGGISRLFNKEIDIKFAEGVSQMLTDPTSPLYQALKPKPVAATSRFPLPVQMFEAEAANAANER